MNAIVFYVAGALSLVFILSAVGLLLGIGDGGSRAAARQLGIAAFFALVAWYAAYDFAGSVEAGEGGE